MLKRFSFQSIRWQLILGVAIVHAVMMALFVWDLTQRQKDLLLERQTDQSMALARSVSTSAAGWVAARDYYGLQEIISSQSRYPELLFAMILDREGKILAHTDIALLGNYVTDLPEHARAQILTRTPALVDAINPIALADNHIGWVRIGLGQRSTAAKLASITRDGVLYATAAIVIGSIIAWYMGSRLTRKLKKIEMTADFVRQGDLDHRAEMDGEDEVSHVAEAFNEMLDGLNDSREELLKAQERIFLATDAAKIGIWDYDLVSGELIWDEWMYRLYGVSSERFTGAYDAWSSLVHPEDIEAAQQQMQQAIEESVSFDSEFRIVKPDQSIHWIKALGSVVLNDEGEAVRLIGTNQDITTQKRQDMTIKQQANYDSLTSLPNRKLLDELLRHKIRVSDREHEKFWVLFLDLDGFKEVNDSFGHALGDALLVRVSERIRSGLRASDITARLGGDEFVVVLSETSESYNVDKIAHKIIDDVSQSFLIADKEIFITTSVGISGFPDDAQNCDDLLRFADQAMYDAKRRGKNRFAYFTPELQYASLRRTEISTDLRKALSNDEFYLQYQPIVELASGSVRKAEALIRWKHPQKGIISPGDFIPVAEETGLIADMGSWIFSEAFSQLSKWQQLAQENEFQLSINLSPYQLAIGEKYYDNWLPLIEEYGVSGSNIVVEITEGLMLKNDPLVNKRLLDFETAGVQVAIDDFGTGYSSLSYLKEFDIDYLKIDQSFVKNLKPGSSEHALSHAIIVMAHKLGLKVIAEGIETDEQRDLLKQMGCDYGQGYLFSRPIEPGEFEKNFLGESSLLFL